jgi:hypothetical protein
MKFSVVIATYNRAPEVQETLASLAGLRPNGSWKSSSSTTTPPTTRARSSNAPRPPSLSAPLCLRARTVRSPALNAGISSPRATSSSRRTTTRVEADWLDRAAEASSVWGGYAGGRVLPIWRGPRPAWLPDRGGKHWG